MEKIEATFRIVTPMFIGGANQDPSDGIRPPSVKGILRFWWRALNWGEAYKQAKGNKSKALKILHEKEIFLFGGAANFNKKSGQGIFLLTVSHDPLNIVREGVVHEDFIQGSSSSGLSSARYLAYGLMHSFPSSKKNTRAGELIRGSINHNQGFNVALLFKGEPDESILSALKLLGLVGGLGSRSRNGMGSITLEKLSRDKEIIWSCPESVEDYSRVLNQLLPCLEEIPPADYSAFSLQTSVDILLKSTDPIQVLDKIGQKILDFRSWGQSSRGNKLPSGNASEMRFEDDHDWYKNVNSFRTFNPDFHPVRVIFGLPHNYSDKEYDCVTSSLYERRSSPLFFHVHKISERQYIGVSVLLPALFLPKKDLIEAGKNNEVAQNINWGILNELISGREGKNSSGVFRFPNRTSVVTPLCEEAQ